MKLTNDELADKARKYKLLGSELERIKSERDLLSVDILAELRRRKRASIDVDGISVTSTSRRIGYDIDKLRSRLSRAVFARITKPVVDGDALAVELKAKTLTKAEIEDAEIRSRPFPTITIPEAKAA